MDNKEYTDNNLLQSSKENIKLYGEEVLKERAIPDFRDGLKPVHRRILWTLYGMGLKFSGGTKKCARIVGECLGRYHPHGDASVYDALVGMTDSSSSVPLVHGQGNFGGIESGAAAFRYTEAKLTLFAEKYLLDPDYLAVTPMVPNYDDTEKEPCFLPSKLPGLFLFGTEGIAVGCSNLVPTFSKNSVVSLVKKALLGEKITGELLAKTLKFQFTYGGSCVSSKKEVKDYFNTGFAKLEFACDLDDGKENHIIVSSMAPRIKPSKLEAALVKIKDIYSVDLIKSRKENSWFDITLKKSADKEDVLEKIYKLTTTSLNLQTYVTVRHDDGEVSFKRTNLVEVLKDWIDWRLDFEKKVIGRLLGLEEVQIQKYVWLIWACDNLKLIMQALESKNPDAYLIKKGGLSKEGANFILSQQVRRLARLELAGLKQKKKEHEKKRVSLERDLKSKKRLIGRVIDTL